jgi:hypothetical protein
MFKGFALGTVRIYGTQEILLALHEKGLSEGEKGIVLTENYIQIPPDKKFDTKFGSEYELNKTQCFQFVDKTEGFYYIEFYEGIKFGQLCTSAWHNTVFFIDDDNYDTWEKNIYDKNSFEYEYTVYLNSAEYAQEKKDRKIRKVEKYLSKLQAVS